MSTATTKGVAAKGMVIAFIAYPFIVHFCIAYDKPGIAAIYLTTLFASLTLLKFRQKQAGSGFLFATLTVVFLLVNLSAYSNWIVYTLPIVLFSGFIYIFGNSLKPGNTPYITQMAQLIREEPLDPIVEKYTRAVTIAWIILFVILALVSILLLLYTPLYIWSYVTNFVNYLLITTFFVVEYSIRRIYLQHINHMGFLSFIKRLIKVSLQK